MTNLSKKEAANSIQLLSGKVIEGFPKTQEEKENSSDAMTADEKMREEKLFMDNVFLFYNNAARILEDSRMFLTPVSISNFVHAPKGSTVYAPTLGVFIEWWIFERAVLTRPNGEIAPACYINGSIAIGGIYFSCRQKNGTMIKYQGKDLPEWQRFGEINERYRPLREKFKAYTLAEVVERLKEDSVDEGMSKGTEEVIKDGMIYYLKKKCSKTEKSYWNLKKDYEELIVFHYKDRLDLLCESVRQQQEIIERDLQRINEAIARYKDMHQKNIISEEEMKALIKPNLVQKSEIEKGVSIYDEIVTQEMLQERLIAFDTIKNYVKQKTEKKNEDR